MKGLNLYPSARTHHCSCLRDAICRWEGASHLGESRLEVALYHPLHGASAKGRVETTLRQEVHSFRAQVQADRATHQPLFDTADLRKRLGCKASRV